MKRTKVFISYSHADEDHMIQLRNHISIIKSEGLVEEWHDRKIIPGEEWDDSINRNLVSSDVILLLLSSDFLGSNYCRDVEIVKAMELHDNDKAKVIPILVRPCDWNKGPYSKLQALPTDAKPITLWSNIDEAWLNVAQGLRDVINSFISEHVSKTNIIGKAKIENSLSSQDREHKIENVSLKMKNEILQEEINRLRKEVNLDPKNIPFGDYYESVPRGESRLKNKESMEIAMTEVLSFSGGTTWAHDLIETIKSRAESGVKFRILCNEPNGDESFETMKALYGIDGVQIKYFKEEMDPLIRGMIVDPSSVNFTYLFGRRIDKNKEGTDVKTNNRNILIFSGSDTSRMQNVMNVLFELSWEAAEDSSIMSLCKNNEIVHSIKKISHYKDAKVSVEHVHVRDLVPLHRYLNRERLESINKLSGRYEHNNIELFQPVKIESKKKVILLAPPIVEIHNGKYVVIDGVHRVYQLIRKDKNSNVWVCLIDGVRDKPAGSPWVWDDVSVGEKSTFDRCDNFKDYNPDNWRCLNILKNESYRTNY